MIILKRSIHQEDITIINICASNNRAPKCMEEKSDKIEGRNRKLNNKSWAFKSPILNNGYNNYVEE